MSTAPTSFSTLAPKAINWSIALSILLIIFGVFAMLIPFVSGIGITLFFAWAMIISGITHFVFAFKTHTTGGVVWELLVGAVYLFTGVFLLMHPLDALIVLTLVLACYLFFEGVVEIIQFIQLRPRHGVVWLLIDGIITLNPRSHDLEILACQHRLGHRHARRNQHDLQRFLPSHARLDGQTRPQHPRLTFMPMS